MNKITYKVLNVIVLTLAWLMILGAGGASVRFFIVTFVYLFKGNIDKVTEFGSGTIISIIVFLVVAKATMLWRDKTIKYRDENDKSIFD